MNVPNKEKEITKINIANDDEKGETINIASEKDKEETLATDRKYSFYSGNVKLQRERISTTSKHKEEKSFEWKSRSHLFYFLAVYSITGDAFGKVQDIANVDKKLTLYHILIVHAIFALPLLYMELFLGQYSKLNCLTFGKITPLASGLGVTMIMLAMTRISTNSFILGDIVLYAFSSMKRPWLECGKHTEDMKNNYNCIPLPEPHERGSNLWSESSNARLSSYVYWRNDILQTNDTSTDVFGAIVTSRLVCLVCIWIFLCLILLTGVGLGLNFLNKFFVWIIGICSCIVMLSLLLTNGASKYLSDIFWTNLQDLINFKVYCYALHICIRTFSFGQGAYILIGTYMNVSISASLQAMLIVVINFLLSLCAYVYHSTALGILSVVYGESKDDLHIQENDFMFATVPHALGVITFSRLLSFLYFLILFSCYCGNSIALCSVILYTITEVREEVKSYRTYIIAGISLICFLVALSFISETGPIQFRCLTINVVLIVRILVVTIETISVLWLYTFPRLCDDIHFIYGSQPAVYWKLVWAFLPFFSLIVLLFYVIDKYKFALCNAWLSVFLYVMYLLSIFLGAIYKTYKNLRKHNLVAVFKPEDDWGPRDPEIRKVRNTMNPRLETRLNRRSYKCRHKCLLRNMCLKKEIAEEEKWYNIYMETADSIGSKSEGSISSEEEEEEDIVGEAAAGYSLYSQISSLTLKSITVNESKSNIRRPDPVAGTSTENK